MYLHYVLFGAGQNPEKLKSRLGQNHEWDKIPENQKFRKPKFLKRKPKTSDKPR